MTKKFKPPRVRMVIQNPDGTEEEVPPFNWDVMQLNKRPNEPLKEIKRIGKNK
jgi:hypothetical protein